MGSKLYQYGITKQETVCFSFIRPQLYKTSFDTINHALIHTRPSVCYGNSGTALSKIQSFLSDRTQQVSVNGYMSSNASLLTGVREGSVLGAILITVYMSPIASLLREHGISHHFYADDKQICVVHCSRLGKNMRTTRTMCAQRWKWMLINHLKLNDGKTEVILIGSKHFRFKLSWFRNNSWWQKCMQRIISVKPKVLFDQ